jgi:hypothetical protein
MFRTFKLVGIKKKELINFFTPLSIGIACLLAQQILKAYFLPSTLVLNVLLITIFLSITFLGVMYILEKDLFKNIYGMKEVVRGII